MKKVKSYGPYIDRLRSKWPYRICRACEPEYEAVLVGVQHLQGQDEPIYRFPGGDCVEDPTTSGIKILEW